MEGVTCSSTLDPRRTPPPDKDGPRQKEGTEESVMVHKVFLPSLVLTVGPQYKVLVDHDGELEPGAHLDRRGDVELPVDNLLAGPVQVRPDACAICWRSVG